MTNTELSNATKIMVGSTEVGALYIGNDLVWSSVPYDAEIEYLESTGTLWIDTGITPNTNTKVIFKFKNLEVTGDVIIGYNESSDTADWRLFNYSSKAYFDLPINNGKTEGVRINGSELNSNLDYELELGNYYVKDLNGNSTIISGNSTSYTGISTITLNHDSYNNRDSKNIFYYVKIYDSDTLVKDLIPVRIGQVGYMYDKVSKQLFGNRGTGDFVLGPDK